MIFSSFVNSGPSKPRSVTLPVRILPPRAVNQVPTASDKDMSHKRTKGPKPPPIPTEKELLLLHKVFQDDEDLSCQYYVVEVKYYQPYKTICCFTASFDGNAENALALYSDLDFSTEEVADKYIFDCDYVSRNLLDCCYYGDDKDGDDDVDGYDENDDEEDPDNKYFG
jgi:hypothetical protein